MTPKEIKQTLDIIYASGCSKTDVAAMLAIPLSMLSWWLTGKKTTSAKRDAQLLAIKTWAQQGCEGLQAWREGGRKKPHPHVKPVETPVVSFDAEKLKKLLADANDKGVPKTDIRYLIGVSHNDLHKWLDGKRAITPRRSAQFVKLQHWVAAGCPGYVEWRGRGRAGENPAGVERYSRMGSKPTLGENPAGVESFASTKRRTPSSKKLVRIDEKSIYTLLDAFNTEEQALRIRFALSFALKNVPLPRKEALTFAVLFLSTMQRIGPLQSLDLTPLLQETSLRV